MALIKLREANEAREQEWSCRCLYGPNRRHHCPVPIIGIVDALNGRYGAHPGFRANSI